MATEPWNLQRAAAFLKSLVEGMPAERLHFEFIFTERAQPSHWCTLHSMYSARDAFSFAPCKIVTINSATAGELAKRRKTRGEFVEYVERPTESAPAEASVPAVASAEPVVKRRRLRAKTPAPAVVPPPPVDAPELPSDVDDAAGGPRVVAVPAAPPSAPRVTPRALSNREQACVPGAGYAAGLGCSKCRYVMTGCSTCRMFDAATNLYVPRAVRR